MKFKSAIVRTPCHNMVHGLTSSDLGIPIYKFALEQHAEYINTMKSCGLNVHCMSADEQFPDSCFVEDTAIVNEKCAVICNMSELSRNGEEISVKKKLTGFYNPSKIFAVKSPGTLDGGDIMRVDDTYYIGFSKRTNLTGAEQLKNILVHFDFLTEFVDFDHCLHLKSEVNYLGDGTLILSKRFQNKPLFQNYEHIIVEQDEVYAANSLRVNNYVITPKGFPNTKKKLLDHGFDIIELEMSEFQKLDGGLSCLSLRF
ncbi:MAG: N(G),N(G)-dimethylarginine dimethylaminohydrolase [Promethearchaeota archaeon]|nr:MAG: N(G),N(G)-dimethylarginine dimethylaminohydrolase [Candidatus Lokiarchaeota archaeon]